MGISPWNHDLRRNPIFQKKCRVFRNNRSSPEKTELVNRNKVPERRFCSRRSGFAPRGPLEVRFAPLESIFLFFLLDKGQCVNHLVEVVISMLERVVQDDENRHCAFNVQPWNKPFSPQIVVSRRNPHFFWKSRVLNSRSTFFQKNAPRFFKSPLQLFAPMFRKTVISQQNRLTWRIKSGIYRQSRFQTRRFFVLSVQWTSFYFWRNATSHMNWLRKLRCCSVWNVKPSNLKNAPDF